MSRTTDLLANLGCDASLKVTAYRSGDTYSLSGRAISASERTLVAAVLGKLEVDELVSLRYSTNSADTLEVYCRVLRRKGDKYEFEFLSLNEWQHLSLEDACDDSAKR